MTLCHKNILLSIPFVIILVFSLMPNSAYPSELTGAILNVSISIVLLGLAIIIYATVKGVPLVMPRFQYFPFFYLLLLVILVSCINNGVNTWTIYFLMLLGVTFLGSILHLNKIIHTDQLRVALLITCVLEAIKLVIVSMYPSFSSQLLMNPNIVAMFIAASLPVILTKNCKTSHFIMAYSIGFMVVLALESRSGLIGIAIGFLYFSYQIWQKHLQNRLYRLSILTLYISAIIAAFVSLNLTKSESTNGRIIIWENTLSLIWEQPLLGSGIGTYSKSISLQLEKYFGQPQPLDNQDNFSSQIFIAYNDLLQLTAENGLLGLALWLSISYMLWQSFLKHKSVNEISVSISCILAMGMTNTCLYAVPCGLLISILISFLSLEKKGKSEPNQNAYRKALNMALLVFLMYCLSFLITIEGAIRETWKLNNDHIKHYNQNLSKLKPYQGVLKNYDFYWIIVAKNFLSAQKYKSALNALDNATEINENINAYKLKYEVYIAVKDTLNADIVLHKIHRVTPGNLYYKYKILISYMTKKDTALALVIAQEILNYSKSTGGDTLFYKEKVRAFLRQHRY